MIDSSALVKNYVSERGSHVVKSLFANEHGHVFYAAHITIVEVVAAIYRCARRGDVSPHEASELTQAFRADVPNHLRLDRLWDAVVERAVDLAMKHVLRGYDAVQLSIALILNERLVAQK